MPEMANKEKPATQEAPGSKEVKGLPRMKTTKKLLKNWYYILGLLFGLSLFYTGISRISSGIRELRLSDQYAGHYANVGVLYVQLGLILMITLAVLITYSLTKHKK